MRISRLQLESFVYVKHVLAKQLQRINNVYVVRTMSIELNKIDLLRHRLANNDVHNARITPDDVSRLQFAIRIASHVHNSTRCPDESLRLWTHIRRLQHICRHLAHHVA